MMIEIARKEPIKEGQTEKDVARGMDLLHGHAVSILHCQGYTTLKHTVGGLEPIESCSQNDPRALREVRWDTCVRICILAQVVTYKEERTYHCCC